MTNPILEDLENPNFSEIKPEHIVPAVDALLATHNAAVDAIISSTSDDFDDIIMAADRAGFFFSRSWSRVGHLHSVMDTPEFREAYDQAREKLTVYFTALGQNFDYYKAFKRVKDSDKFATLSAEKQRMVDLSLRDFQLSGVALEGADKERFSEISAELSKLTTEFSNAVLDSTEAWFEHHSSADTLPGLPETELSLLKSYAEERELDGYVVNLRAPCINAVMTYCEDRDLRFRVYRANSTRASDQFFDTSYDNSDRISQIMALRAEKAKLLGFDNYASLSLEPKMAGTPDEVVDFILNIVNKAKPFAESDIEAMAEYAKNRFGFDTLEPWDTGFVSYWYQKEMFDVDEEVIKQYFPKEQVISGVKNLVSKLYSIKLEERSEVSVWHPDVIYYEVKDQNDNLIAGVYLDLFARSGKRGGAWMDVCQARFRDGNEFYHPIAFLTTNFSPATDGMPSLLTHDDVITTLHEFGHVFHHLLTEIDMPGLGGIEGVEWDAVELPSQFMENFAWDLKYLEDFSSHYKTGEKLPKELFDKMLNSKNYNSGLATIRQMEFSLFDFLLHKNFSSENPLNYMDVLNEVRDQVSVMKAPEWNRFPNTFGHIFSGGYAAGYYSYMWAEVLSADAYEIMLGYTDGPSRFRKEILAVGSSRPANENFKSFAGREPNIDALFRSRGLTK